MKLPPKQGKRGFTLGEIMISLGIFGVVSTVLFSIVQATSVLLAKNMGINMTHNTARIGTERLFSLIQSAIAAPILVDASVSPVAGTGPAAGITFVRLADPATYTSVNAATATATSLKIRRVAPQPAPEAGSILVMVGPNASGFSSPYILGFQGTIATVTAVNSTDSTVTFSDTVGSLCNPATSSGTVLPATTKLFLFNKMACIASGTELRLLNNASVPNTYNVLATLVPKTGQTQVLPFTATATDKRLVDLDLRVQSTSYSKRNLDTTNTFFDLKESIAYRSAILVQDTD